MIGEIVLSENSNYDIAPKFNEDGYVVEGTTLLSSEIDVSGTNRRTFKLLFDQNGYCKIRDASSLLVMEETVDADGTSSVVLNNYDSTSTAQKWIVIIQPDGTHSYINAETGHAITINGTLVTAEGFNNSDSQKYRFIYKYDVDQNGVISAKDLLLMRQYISGNAELTAEQFYAADIDDNGSVTGADMALLKMAVVGQSTITDEDEATNVYTASQSRVVNIDYEWLLTCSDEEFLTYLLGTDYASYSVRCGEIIFK
jgi:hypothetical protein